MFDKARLQTFATLAVHGGPETITDVAPPLHVSTNYYYPEDPVVLDAIGRQSMSTPQVYPPPLYPPITDPQIYSRVSSVNTARLDPKLSEIVGGPCVSYSTGLSALFALLVYVKPKVVAIGHGYSGCQTVLEMYQRLTGCKIVDLHDEKTWDAAGLGAGDLVHLETPNNPTGNAYNIEAFAKKVHARKAFLNVDATFAPPPLQDPFKHGADFIMHSGTKFFGGHSDILWGFIAVSPNLPGGWEKAFWGLYKDRMYLGSVMGNMEGWLANRSLLTMEMRVKRQNKSARKLVGFLADALKPDAQGADAVAVKNVVLKVEHASLQAADMSWLKEQMPGGFGSTFVIYMKSEQLARSLPGNLSLFSHATSLGAVESLIEWRKILYKDAVDPRELRISVGVEHWEDLKKDLVNAFKVLAPESEPTV